MTPFAVTVIWFLTTLNNAGELAVVDKTDLPSGITSTAMWSEGQCSYVRANGPPGEVRLPALPKRPVYKVGATKMNKTMVIGLSVLLWLYLAFGLMGCARADEEDTERQSHEEYTRRQSLEINQVTVYVPIICGASLKDWFLFSAQTYNTPESCRASLPGPDQFQRCIPLKMPACPPEGVNPCSDMCCGP